MTQPIAALRDVSVHFPQAGPWPWSAALPLRAVDGVSLDIGPGEVLGLVGESGSGKSTIGRALLRLQPVTAGSVHFEGVDITAFKPRQLMPIRKKLQVVFQDPEASLNPRMTIGAAIGEALRVHGSMTGKERQRRIAELLKSVGLDSELLNQWPHELSGGQRQRLGLARALATEPLLLVLDEPISALDMSIQAQILNLLSDLRAQRRLSYLFISHDLAAVAHLSDRVAVLYAGRIVEIGTTAQVLDMPKHPYTQALKRSVLLPDPKQARNRGLQALQGEMPTLQGLMTGCALHPRCPLATQQCREKVPQLRDVDGRQVACHMA